MRRLFYGMIVTAIYTLLQYVMLINYDSMIAHLIPIILLGFAMSCLWDIGFKAGLKRGAECVEDVE